MFDDIPSVNIPTCSICDKPVPLEAAKTDEHGRAIHEDCYWIKVRSEHGSDSAEPSSNS